MEFRPNISTFATFRVNMLLQVLNLFRATVLIAKYQTGGFQGNRIASITEESNVAI